MEQRAEQDLIKKGTTTIGILCKDGIVLAAEKRATTGTFISNRKMSKVYKITDFLVITTAGTVSDVQLLSKLIKAELKLKQIRSKKESNTREAANLLGGLIYGNIRKFSLIPGLTQFVMAGYDDEGFHIYDLFMDGSVIDCDDYVASGSGSIVAYGVLEALYTKDLTLKEGVDLAIKSLNAAIRRDAASGDGVEVHTLTKEGLKLVFEKQIETTLRA